MSFLTITDERCSSTTTLPNLFVDLYMPRANGEFVKIYIFLLRIQKEPGTHLSLSSLADVFSCTEKDILRALRYWEKAGLLGLKFKDKVLTDIRVLPIASESTLDEIEEEAPEEESAPSSEDPGESSMPEPLSGTRIRQLQKNDPEVRELLFVAEAYLGQTLSPTDIGRILYFYDALSFPADLIDYLIQYCVSRGNKSLRYIEKVGLNWHAEGVRTVKDAKAHSTAWSKNYNAILKSFGIRGRAPIPNEVEYMDKWLKEYGFSVDIIEEACSRTIKRTGKISFPYAESILKDWHKAGVRSFREIESLDSMHQNSAPGKALSDGKKAYTSSQAASGNRFRNFPERKRDIQDTERRLLEKQRRSHNDA